MIHPATRCLCLCLPLNSFMPPGHCPCFSHPSLTPCSLFLVHDTHRVGNLLGSGMPRLARKSGYLSIVMTIACVTPVAIAIFAARNVLGRAFSGDSKVIATMAVIAPYAALLQVR